MGEGKGSPEGSDIHWSPRGRSQGVLLRPVGVEEFEQMSVGRQGGINTHGEGEDDR